MEKEFIPYDRALKMKELGFNEPCIMVFSYKKKIILPNKIPFEERTNGPNPYTCTAPTFSQAINFLYVCSNKQIDIELKASDTYEERLRKIDQGCEDLWNLQNSKSN